MTQSAFGEDAFGRYAEGAARFFGTPQYIVGQTLVVAVWITLNALGLSLGWDPYPFILLAQTRQADRDKLTAERDIRHRDTIIKHLRDRENDVNRQTHELRQLLEANTNLTRQDKELTETVAALTREIHDAVRAG